MAKKASSVRVPAEVAREIAAVATNTQRSVAFVVWRIAKLFERPAEPAAPARACQFCRMEIDAAASRCPHCTSQL